MFPLSPTLLYLYMFAPLHCYIFICLLPYTVMSLYVCSPTYIWYIWICYFLFVGAVAGLADQPLRGLSQPVGNVPPSPTQAATGIVSGVGKGIVGAFTKPIGE